jgi:hypothetical protein
MARLNPSGLIPQAKSSPPIRACRSAPTRDLPPLCQEFLEKLEHIEGAVAHHGYEEESNWFMDLTTKTLAADQVKLTLRYQEQFARYRGDESDI